MEANVYDDIDDFDLGEEIERLKTENQLYSAHIRSLEEDVEKLTATVEKLNSNQDILKTNISRLFLTAKEEIARKDRMIADLRSQLDDICFRRNMPDSRPDLKRKEIEETVEAVVTKKFKSDSTEEKSHDVDHRSKSKPRPEQNSDTFSARDTKSRSKSIEREDRYKNRSRRHEDRDRKHRYRKEVFDVDGRRERSKSLKYEDNRRYSRYSNQDVRKRSDSPKYNSYDHSLHEANKILERPENTTRQSSRYQAKDKRHEVIKYTEHTREIYKDMDQKKRSRRNSENVTHTSNKKNKSIEQVVNKPIKKRLKMLDVVEEKIRQKKSTPIKLESSCSNQSRNSCNFSKNLKDVLGEEFIILSDIPTIGLSENDDVKQSAVSCPKSVKETTRSSKTESKRTLDQVNLQTIREQLSRLQNVKLLHKEIKEIDSDSVDSVEHSNKEVEDNAEYESKLSASERTNNKDTIIENVTGIADDDMQCAKTLISLQDYYKKKPKKRSKNDDNNSHKQHKHECINDTMDSKLETLAESNKTETCFKQNVASNVKTSKTECHTLPKKYTDKDKKTELTRVKKNDTDEGPGTILEINDKMKGTISKFTEYSEILTTDSFKESEQKSWECSKEDVRRSPRIRIKEEAAKERAMVIQEVKETESSKIVIPEKDTGDCNIKQAHPPDQTVVCIPATPDLFIEDTLAKNPSKWSQQHSTLCYSNATVEPAVHCKKNKEVGVRPDSNTPNLLKSNAENKCGNSNGQSLTELTEKVYRIPKISQRKCNDEYMQWPKVLMEVDIDEKRGNLQKEVDNVKDYSLKSNVTIDQSDFTKHEGSEPIDHGERQEPNKDVKLDTNLEKIEVLTESDTKECKADLEKVIVSIDIQKVNRDSDIIKCVISPSSDKRKVDTKNKRELLPSCIDLLMAKDFAEDNIKETQNNVIKENQTKLEQIVKKTTKEVTSSECSEIKHKIIAEVNVLSKRRSVDDDSEQKVEKLKTDNVSEDKMSVSEGLPKEKNNQMPLKNLKSEKEESSVQATNETTVALINLEKVEECETTTVENKQIDIGKQITDRKTFEIEVPQEFTMRSAENLTKKDAHKLNDFSSGKERDENMVARESEARNIVSCDESKSDKQNINQISENNPNSKTVLENNQTVDNFHNTVNPKDNLSCKSKARILQVIHICNGNVEKINKDIVISSPEKTTTKKRITPIPVKEDKPICSFENLFFEKNSKPVSFTSDLPATVSPLHLTHEGEIPVLHLEENVINNLPTETNANDGNILNLLDSMSISNMECEMTKFKNIPADSGNTTHNPKTNVSLIKEDESFTFSNIMSQVTSTPINTVNNTKDERCHSDIGKDHSKSDMGSGSSFGKIMSTSLPITGFRKRRRCRLIIRD